MDILHHSYQPMRQNIRRQLLYVIREDSDLSLNVFGISCALLLSSWYSILCDEAIARVQRNESLLHQCETFELVRKRVLASKPAMQLSCGRQNPLSQLSHAPHTRENLFPHRETPTTFKLGVTAVFDEDTLPLTPINPLELRLPKHAVTYHASMNRQGVLIVERFIEFLDRGNHPFMRNRHAPQLLIR